MPTLDEYLAQKEQRKPSAAPSAPMSLDTYLSQKKQLSPEHDPALQQRIKNAKEAEIKAEAMDDIKKTVQNVVRAKKLSKMGSTAAGQNVKAEYEEDPGRSFMLGMPGEKGMPAQPSREITATGEDVLLEKPATLDDYLRQKKSEGADRLFKSAVEGAHAFTINPETNELEEVVSAEDRKKWAEEGHQILEDMPFGARSRVYNPYAGMSQEQLQEMFNQKREQGESLLEGIDFILGAPYRVLGAGVEGTRERFKQQFPLAMGGFNQMFPEQSKKLHGMLGMKPPSAMATIRMSMENTPKMSEGERIWKSLTYERPTYLSNVFVDSMKETLGRDLSKGEAIAVALFGLGSELALTPWMFPGKGGMAPREVVPGQLERAAARSSGSSLWGRLKGGGFKPKIVTEAGEELEVIRDAARKLDIDPAIVDDILTKETHVERVQAMMDYGKKLAADAGIDPAIMEDNLRRIWGPSAKRFGQAGMTIGSSKVGGKKEIIPAGTFDRRAPPKSEFVRYGAEEIGGNKAKAISWQLSQQKKALKELDIEFKAEKLDPNEYATKAMQVQDRIEGLNGILERMESYKGPINTLQEELHYFAGAPEDVKDLARQAYAKQQMGIEDAARAGQAMRRLTKKQGLMGRLMGRLSGKQDPSKTAGRILDIEDREAELVQRTREWRGDTKRGLQTMLDDLKDAAARGEIDKEVFKSESKELRKAINAQPKVTLYEAQEEIANMERTLQKLGPEEGALQKSLEGDLRGMRDTQAEVQQQLNKMQTGFNATVASNMQPYLQRAEKKLLLTMNETDAADYLYRVYKGQQGALTEGQRKAMTLYRKKMDELFNEFEEAGGNISYRNNLFAKIETAESRKKHIKVYGEPNRAGARKSGVEGRTAAEGSHGREFYTSLDESYQQYALKQSMAIANMKGENALLETVGRQLDPLKAEVVFNKANGNWHVNHELLDRAASEGLVVYYAKMGKYAKAADEARYFLVPKSAATALERMSSVEKMGRVYRTLNRLTSSWKTFATVWRPGFVSRNIFFGNLFNMYLADVDIARSVGEAARLQAYRYARQTDGLLAHAMVKESFLRGVQRKVGRVVRKGMTKKAGGLGKAMKGTDRIGSHTVDEILALAEKHGVFAGDFTTAELRQMSRNRLTINPFSKDFYWARMVGKVNKVAEDNARLAVFVDKLRKGYSPTQAADFVARHLFNYNEVTRFGIHARRMAFPFFTWPVKNWGLQLTSLLNKPGKAASIQRGIQGLEATDPVEGRQADRERVMPKSMRLGGYFRIPEITSALAGFEDNPEGVRSYIPLGNLMPLHSLNQLAIQDPGQFLRNVGDMLHPIWKILLEQGGAAPSIGTFGFHGVPFSPSEYSTREAGPFMSGFMDWLHENHPKLEGVMQWAGIVPNYGPNWQLYLAEARKRGLKGRAAIRWVEKHAPRVNYQTPAIFNYIFEALHPGLKRVLDTLGEDEAYDQTKSYWFGLKPFELTDERAIGYHKDYQMELGKELREIEESQKKAGILPGSTLQTIRGLSKLAD